MTRPNIILTFADDQRHSMLGCCDGRTADAVHTPALDALADRGCRFTHAYHAGSPQGAVCMPSRGMLHTGRGPFDTCPNMVTQALGPGYSGTPQAPTLGQLLRESGYHTHFVGKWHNLAESFKRSFDSAGSIFFGGMTMNQFDVPISRWDGKTLQQNVLSSINVHSVELFSEDARDFLSDYVNGENSDKPFFLCVAFTAPHDPRTAHKQFHDKYPPDDIELPPNFRGEHPFDNGCLNIRDEKLTPRPRDPGQTQYEMANYYALNEHMDCGIGRIHQALDDLGLTENTIVIHSVDHGLAVGQHGLMGKQNLYDHSTRVPLIMAGPGIDSQQRRTGLCYQHDLFPTLLETAGCAIPPQTAYRSLWPMLRGERATNYDLIGCYYADQQRMVSDGHNKFIRYRVKDKVFDQCFDLDVDPWETIDDTGRPLNPSNAIGETELHQWQKQMGDPWLEQNMK